MELYTKYVLGNNEYIMCCIVQAEECDDLKSIVFFDSVFLMNLLGNLYCIIRVLLWKSTKEKVIYFPSDSLVCAFTSGYREVFLNEMTNE